MPPVEKKRACPMLICPRRSSGGGRSPSGGPRSPGCAPPQPPFFADPEVPFAAPAGYYALVRHADVVEASRNPEVFSSGQGATSIDRPARRVQRVLRLDDQHGRSAARPAAPDRVPRVHPADDQEVRGGRAAGGRGIVDDLLATGPCDFVQHVAARLPLKIICQMMGIADEHYAMVLRDTNIILSGADPEFISEDLDEAVGQILTAGAELADLVTGLAPSGWQEPEGRPDHRAGHREHRRRAAHQRRTRLVLHPAGGGRQRDHPERDLARADAADRPPRPAGAAAGRLRGPDRAARSRRSSGTARR